MSNEISNQKFYRFLANFEQNNSNWANVADTEYGNSNGEVIKSEFRKFMQGEWANWNGEEGGTELSNSIINNFWKKLDTSAKGTDLNKLNDKEMEAMDTKIQAYVQLNEFIDANVKAPNVLSKTGQRWKADVSDDLAKIVEDYLKKGATGDLDSLLTEQLPAIENKNTAEFCAVEYQETLKNSLLKDYPEYKVALDDTLSGIIEKYLETVTAESDANTIFEDIKGIMDAYMATAGIGEGSGVDLSQYGYAQNPTDKLNDIQKSVAEQSIKNNLKDLEQEADFAENKTLYDAAIAKFITRTLGEATAETYNTLLDLGVEDFKGSTEGTTLKNRISVEDQYRKMDTSSEFYNTLKGEFGEALANTIAKDGRYIATYQNIIDSVLNQIDEGKFVDANGALDNKAISEFVLGEIAKNLDDFFPNGLKDLEIDDLNNIYDVRAEAADAEEDNDKSLSLHRDAALDYCKALVSKHKNYENEVIKVFGENWKQEISKMYPSEIQTKMTKLKTAAAAMPKPVILDANTAVAWTGAESAEVIVGKSIDLQVGAHINGIDASKIKLTAELADGKGSVKIDDLGKLTVQAGDSAGYIKVNVYATVDGQKVGTPREITITVKEAPSTSELIANSATLKNATGAMQTSFLKDDLNGSKNSAINLVQSFVNGLKSGLIKEGFEEEKVNYAITSTINYYTALISALSDKSGCGLRDEWKSAEFSYTDGNGTSKSSSANFYHWQVYNKDKNGSQSTNNESGVAIIEHVRTLAKNEWSVSVSKSVVAAKLKEFLGAV